MIGTPYVSRNQVWKKDSRGNAVLASGDKIVIGVRTWDGIDKPEYSEDFSLRPDEARYIATEIWKLAEQIDGKNKKDSKIGVIRKRTKQIAQQAKKEAMDA